jgi:hypothetical protein
VRFENPGPVPWPGLAVDPRGLVVLAGTWEREDGSPAADTRPLTVRLANDVPVGASVTLRVPVQAPEREAPYRLSLSVVQQDFSPLGDPVRVGVDVKNPPPRSKAHGSSSP